MQRRATKLVKEFKNLNYEEQLVKLNLTTMEERHLRGDLIQIYKIIRFNFLTYRNVNDWNALPEEIVRANNLNSFKEKIDEWLKRKLL